MLQAALRQVEKEGVSLLHKAAAEGYGELVGWMCDLDPKACQALLDYLKSPEAEAVYKARGIMPVK